MATDLQMNHYERINQVRQYIREHMDEPVNREVLARIDTEAAAPAGASGPPLSCDCPRVIA